ncbi:MAG: tetratricopeptide repeat protein [Oscillospiraceae bacterium]|nr:tetratricopeptide repeat protein [Oscillospiraceae bacterium]
MERLDFYSVINVIRKNISENKATDQVDLLYELFSSFASESGFYFDYGLVCKWFNGQNKISPQIPAFYSKSENFGKLVSDIEKRILPLMFDSPMAVSEIYEILIADTGISEKKKQRLLEKYLCENDFEEAEFLASVLLFAMERNFIKRDSKTKSVPKAKTSPDISDYIFGCGVPSPCKNFCGREAEIESLHELLCKNEKVFLCGIAGIGKSETAKAYAKQYKKEYTNIIYLTYSGNLEHDISEMVFADDSPEENFEKRFSRHSRFLKTLKSDSLLIIDNFDTTYSEEKLLWTVLKFGCRVIFTTRSRFDNQKCLELREISDQKALLGLMGKYYSCSNENSAVLMDIISAVHSHTLAVELAARLLENGILEPEELAEKLRKEKASLDSSDKIKLFKDGKAEKETYYNHIHTLFSLYKLSKDETDFMRNLIFIPSSGISGKLFARWLNLKNMNVINDLIEKGFVQEGTGKSILLHPMIKEVALDETKPTIKNCITLIESLQYICLRHGETVPYYLPMFHTIENILDMITDDDTEKFLLFMENVFPYMDCYDYKYGMKCILFKMESVLKDPSVGTASDRALLHEYNAFLEDNITKRIKEEEKALSLITEINEENALLTANICSNLGSLYRISYNYSKAKEYMERGIQIIEKYNLTTYDTVTQLANYSALLVDTGDFDSGVKMYEKVLKIMKKSGGDNTLGCAEILRSLGFIYYLKSDFKNGLKYYKKSLKIYEDIFKDEPEKIEEYKNEIQNDYVNVGTILGKVGQKALKNPK